MFYHSLTGKNSWLLFLLLCLAPILQANNQAIKKGNQAYQQSNYKEALSHYDKAARQAPENSLVFFNQGAAYYRLADFKRAREQFKQAALKSKNVKQTALAYYNLGNCAFRLADQQKGHQIQQAISLLGESMQYYQQALQLDPALKQAAYNIEVTRLQIKKLQEQLKQEQAQNQERQAKQNEIREKLLKIAEKEKQQIKYSRELAREQKSKGTQPVLKNNARQLAKAQEKINQETRAVARQLEELNSQSQPAARPGSPFSRAKEHVDKSTAYQQAAQKELGQYQMDQTVSEQEQALDEIEKAIQALSDQSQPDQNQNQGQDQQPQKQNPANQSAQNEQAAEQEKAARQEAVQAVAAEILNEEKENNKQRQKKVERRYNAPQKDW